MIDRCRIIADVKYSYMPHDDADLTFPCDCTETLALVVSPCCPGELEIFTWTPCGKRKEGGVCAGAAARARHFWRDHLAGQAVLPAPFMVFAPGECQRCWFVIPRPQLALDGGVIDRSRMC